MEEVLVSPEVARLLWEKGLPKTEVVKYCTYVPIDGNILEYLPMIPQSLAQKWLREIHHITFNASPHSYNDEIIYVVTIKVISNKKPIDFNIMMSTSNKAIMFKTYEDAIEAGLKYCLESI